MDSRQYVKDLERHGRETYKRYAEYRVTVPCGKSGPWAVRKFTTDMGIAYMRLARDGRPSGLGEFTALSHDRRGIVMSDTCAEIDDLRPFWHFLRGNVFVSGLGLGMVVHILTKCKSEYLTSLTVIEKDADVIKLTADHYRQSDPRVTIIHADALEWTPPKGAVYDAAWHDIWDEICEDNRAQMTAMRRHYQRYVAKGEQYCWGQLTMDRERRTSYR